MMFRHLSHEFIHGDFINPFATALGRKFFLQEFAELIITTK